MVGNSQRFIGASFSFHVVAEFDIFSRECVFCSRKDALPTNVIRSLMQRIALACGSMVLYLYCISFFARPGEKRDTKD
jgi:hypothetical protein